MKMYCQNLALTATLYNAFQCKHHWHQHRWLVSVYCLLETNRDYYKGEEQSYRKVSYVLYLCEQETASGLVRPKGSFSHRPTSPLGAL